MGWLLSWQVVVLVVLLAVFGWYLSFTAGRLDRLHARVESARATLDAQLVRRSSVVLELATSQLLDPASSLLLAGAAHEARESEDRTRGQAESDLSKALRAVLDDGEVVEELRHDPTGGLLVEELAGAAQRVELARRFHNDAVRATVHVRRTPVVRWLRLAGHAPWPTTFEMDDERPAGLPR